MATKVLTSTEFRKHISYVANCVAYRGDRVVMARHGKKHAVLMSWEDYELILAHRPEPKIDSNKIPPLGTFDDDRCAVKRDPTLMAGYRPEERELGRALVVEDGGSPAGAQSVQSAASGQAAGDEEQAAVAPQVVQRAPQVVQRAPQVVQRALPVEKPALPRAEEARDEALVLGNPEEMSLEELERICALIPDGLTAENLDAWCWKGRAIGIIKHRKMFAGPLEQPS